MAFIPVAVASVIKEQKTDKAAVSASASRAPGKTAAASEARPASEEPRHVFLAFFAYSLGLGLISPFYELTTSFGSGLIGLLILFWGMQAAWKLMAAPKVVVDGPFGAEAG